MESNGAAPQADTPRAGSHAVNLVFSQLTDSFANGWQITMADLHTLGGPDFTVTLTWTPQKVEWGALALSAGTLFLCLLLAFMPTRPRRLAARPPAAAPARAGRSGRTRAAGGPLRRPRHDPAVLP